MILVPGWMWRRGPVGRGAGAGLAAGVFRGAFALLEPGSWPGAVVVLVVLSLFSGIRVTRRTGRLWPEARSLSGADRAAVVRTTRRARPAALPAGASVVGQAAALRRAVEEDRLPRWAVLLVTALVRALAVLDTLTGSSGETVASWLVVVLVLAELMWGPHRHRLLPARP